MRQRCSTGTLDLSRMKPSGMRESINANTDDCRMTALQLERWIARKLRLRHFELIAEVYDCRSIIKASKRLSLTQPAVTKAVHDIETALNLPLFERTNRGLEPTVYGEVVARHAKILLAQLRHTAEELENLRIGYGGHIYIGTLLAASAMLLPEAIALLKKERPAVAITVIEGTYDVLIPSLLVDDLDMVLGRLPENGRNVELLYEQVHSEPISLVTRRDHPLAGAQSLDLKDLLDEPWLLPLPETDLRRQIEKEFLDAGLPLPRNITESVSILTNLTLLRKSNCIGVMPYHVAMNDVEHNLLATLPIELQLDARPVGAITRAARVLPPAAAALLDCVRLVGKDIGAKLRDAPQADAWQQR